MSSNTHCDDWLEQGNLPGEKLVVKLEDVFFLNSQWNVHGVFCMTNYRIYFLLVAPDKRKPGNNSRNYDYPPGMNCMDCSVPLACIERMKLDEISLQGENLSTNKAILELICKDTRNMKFGFLDASLARRAQQCLQPYVFCDLPYLFAFDYKKASTAVKSTDDASIEGKSLDIVSVPKSLNVFGPVGWKMYDVEQDFRRMGVPNERWRLSNVNTNFQICTSYPRVLCIPTMALISDDDMVEVGKFRSKGRVPAMVWIRKGQTAALLRCSQPCVGISGDRNEADERFFEAVALLNPAIKPNDNARGGISGAHPPVVTIYDARPKMNAFGNRLKGKGVENVQYYPSCSLVFLNIENIHTMRSAYNKVKRLCTRERTTVVTPPWVAAVTGIASSSSGSANSGSSSNLDNTSSPGLSFDFQKELAATDWLTHLTFVLQGTYAMVYDMDVRGRSTVCHCSDGWDRTSQLASLVQLCLDPVYRTKKGFLVLIDKDWLSFGHQFARRTGHGDANHADSQRSPVFLQFCDCVFQLTEQFPSHFEFNSFFLVTLVHHLYSCRFGTFLCNTLQERLVTQVYARTRSLWEYMLAPERSRVFDNPYYKSPTPGYSSIDDDDDDDDDAADHDKTKKNDGKNNVEVLYPAYTPKVLVFWSDYFCQYIDENNIASSQNECDCVDSCVCDEPKVNWQHPHVKKHIPLTERQMFSMQADNDGLVAKVRAIQI